MKVCRFSSILLTFLVLQAACNGASADNSDRQRYLEDIRRGALQYLQTILTQQYPNDRLDISLSNPDPRIALPRCDKDLTYEPHGNALNTSNVTIKASCSGQEPWSFYLRAQVDYWRAVAVADRSIRRGELISAADVREESRQLSRSGLSTHLLPEGAVGLLAKRAIPAGDLIKSTHVEAPLAVKRGDVVKIRSAGGAVQIETIGEALSNGRIGEQIRIKNLRSERVVRAMVVAPGETEVTL